MDSSTPTPHGGGHGAAGDSIVLEEEIDQNYVPSEVRGDVKCYVSVLWSAHFCVIFPVIKHTPPDLLCSLCDLLYPRQAVTAVFQTAGWWRS